jgi:thiol-disulfide isomerase/thioredoxin
MLNPSFRFTLTLLSLACFAWIPPVFAGDDLPDVTVTTAQGSLRLSELRGQVVYVDFWASWCVPCRKSFPWMNQLQQQYSKQGLKIVAINLDKDPQLAKQFLADFPANFTVAYDPEGLSATQFKVQAMPTSYVIDRQGKLQATHLGFREKDTAAMEAEIKALVSK